MQLTPFKLERYFAQYEFSVKYLLSSSDCDGLLQSELVDMADAQLREMWDDLALGYTESLGHPLLRAEIASLYPGISSDECLVCVPEEGIFMAMNCLLQPGDHVICTFPGYQSLYQVAESLGCPVTRWAPDEDAGWRFDPDFLEGSILPETRLVVVNFPHNPTGSLPSKADYQRILELVREHNLTLFSDEMYRFLEYDENDRLPSACTVSERAVSLCGMSKTFGMAGARLGWLATRDAGLYARLAAFKDYTTICSNASAEVLSIIALRNREQIVARHLARIHRNLALLDAFFAEFGERFEWVKPRAGTIALPRLKGATEAQDFCQRLVREANIMLLPSTVYEYDDHHFRFGFGRENLPEALQALSAYIKRR